MNINVNSSRAQGVFINNEWHPGRTARTIPVIAPADGQPFAVIAAGGAEDVDAAVSAARLAFDQGSWGRLTATERGRLLTRLAHLVQDHADQLASLRLPS